MSGPSVFRQWDFSAHSGVALTLFVLALLRQPTQKGCKGRRRGASTLLIIESFLVEMGALLFSSGTVRRGEVYRMVLGTVTQLHICSCSRSLTLHHNSEKVASPMQCRVRVGMSKTTTSACLPACLPVPSLYTADIIKDDRRATDREVPGGRRHVLHAACDSGAGESVR